MDIGHIKTMAGHTQMVILHIKTVTTPQGGYRTYNNGHNAWFSGLWRGIYQGKDISRRP